MLGALCLSAGSGADGAPVVIVPCDGGADQRWSYTAAGELRTPAGQCADVAGGRTDDGAPIIVWPCHGESNQRWNAGG